ncbi:MAG: Ig-like domain-containing protein [Vicinamibacterales bacterium]
MLPAGDTAFASLEGRTTQGGLAIVSVPVSRWTSSNPSVATVTNTGNVTAVAPGTAALTATFDGGSQAATVAVFGDRDIEGLTVTCGDIPPGVQGVFCTVAARTRLGSGPVKATWRSSRPDVGSLATDGSTPSVAIVVQRETPGQTVITATYGTFSATATIEVRP